MNTDTPGGVARPWQPPVDVRGDTAGDGAPARTSLAFDVQHATTRGGDSVRVYAIVNLLTAFRVVVAFDDTDDTDAGHLLDRVLWAYRCGGTQVEAVLAADESLRRPFVSDVCEVFGADLLACDPSPETSAAARMLAATRRGMPPPDGYADHRAYSQELRFWVGRANERASLVKGGRPSAEKLW